MKSPLTRRMRAGKDGYKGGYAIGGAEAREELEDLLVCLGQRVARGKVREMLAGAGADMDAVIAEFELEEEEEMARLVAKETEIVDDERVVEEDVHVREEDVVEEEELRCRNFAISWRHGGRDRHPRARPRLPRLVPRSSRRGIHPSDAPKASKHDASERNLAAAFECAWSSGMLLIKQPRHDTYRRMDDDDDASATFARDLGAWTDVLTTRAVVTQVRRRLGAFRTFRAPLGAMGANRARDATIDD